MDASSAPKNSTNIHCRTNMPSIQMTEHLNLALSYARNNIFLKFEYIPYKKLIARRAGPRLNIKTVLSTYGDFHVKDKTAARTSYL